MTTDTIQNNQAETTTTTEVEFVSDALKALKEYFSKKRHASSIELPTDKLYPCLKALIRDIETALGIPKQPTFLKLVYVNSEFSSMRTLELGLVEGKPHFILGGTKIFPANDFLFGKDKPYQYLVDGKPENKDCSTWLILSINDEAGNLPIKVWTSTDELADNAKLRKSENHFCQYVKEYIFPLACLPVGSYPVQELFKVNKLLAAKINNRYYYVKQKVYDQLVDRKKESLSQILHIDPETTYNVDGKVIKTRPYYAEGYAPALSLKALVAKYREIPNDIEALKAEGRITFEKPIQMKVEGLTTTIFKEEMKQLLVVSVEGNKHNIYPNSAMNKAIEQGRLKVNNFDNYFINVVSVEEYNKGVSVKLEWDIPSASIPSDDTLDSLEADLLSNF